MKKLKLQHLFFSVAFACVIRSIWMSDDLIARWAITGIVVGIVGAFIELNQE